MRNPKFRKNKLFAQSYGESPSGMIEIQTEVSQLHIPDSLRLRRLQNHILTALMPTMSQLKLESS